MVLCLFWVGPRARGVALNIGQHLKQPKNINNSINIATAVD